MNCSTARFRPSSWNPSRAASARCQSNSRRSSARPLSRCSAALHLESGRAEERLLFDWQRALAARLGFQDDGRNLAVEQFMQTFYRAAGAVERVLSQLLERFEEYLRPLPEPQPLDEHFAARGTRLALREEDLLAREPRAMVAAFA